MNYIFSKVIKRLAINIKDVLLIFIQISIGITALVILTNVTFYINSEYKNLITDGENYKYKIYAKSKESGSDMPFLNESQYSALSGISDADITFEIYSEIITFTGSSHYEGNEEIFDNYIIKYSSAVKEAYAEPEFLAMFNNINSENTINYDKLYFSINNMNIKFSDGDMAAAIISNGSDRYVHTLTLPIEYCFKYCSSVDHYDRLEITVNIQNTDLQVCNKKLYEIEQILENTNNSYDYIIESKFFDFLRKSASDKEQAMLFTIISAALILIVYIGIISLFVMLIEKRTFEMSVCLAFGADIRSLVFEVASELLIISFAPVIISLIFIFICFHNGYEFINVYIPCPDTNINAAVLTGVLFADIICLMPICVKLHKLKPQEILHEY